MSFMAGVRCFTDAVPLVRRKNLRHFVWLPLIVSFAVILPGVFYGLSMADDAVVWMMSHIPDWLSFLDVILTPLLYLLGVLISAWLFSFLAIIVGSPFLGILSARTEDVFFQTRHVDERKWWQAVAPTLLRELRKLGYHIPRLLLVFLFTLIPLINTVSPIVWFVFGAWIMAVQFMDYPVENRIQDFKVCINKLKKHRTFALGFGACASLALSIPLLNFVAIPVCVVGGTLAWNRMDQESPGNR